jgi:hypothetical protein
LAARFSIRLFHHLYARFVAVDYATFPQPVTDRAWSFAAPIPHVPTDAELRAAP